MGKSHTQTLQLVDVTAVTHSGPSLTHLVRQFVLFNYSMNLPLWHKIWHTNGERERCIIL